jgi:hypothetical protein
MVLLFFTVERAGFEVCCAVVCCTTGCCAVVAAGMLSFFVEVFVEEKLAG